MSYIVNRVEHGSVTLVAGPIEKVRDAVNMMRALKAGDAGSLYGVFDQEGRPVDLSQLDVLEEDESFDGDDTVTLHISSADEGVVSPGGVLTASTTLEAVAPPLATLAEEAAPVSPQP